MKKILLSTALALALSAPSIAATTTMPAAATPAPAGDMAKHETVKVANKQMLTKEQWLAKIATKRDKVVAAAAKLDGAEKALVESALARADRWVKTITSYTDAGTSYGRSAVRAMNELGWAQAVTHYKDPYPTQNVEKAMAKFEALKAKAANLTGDMKAAADTMIANTQSVADDLKAHKGTTFMSQLVHGLHKEIWALKRFLNKATKEATPTVVAAPAAMTPVPAMDSKVTKSK